MGSPAGGPAGVAFGWVLDGVLEELLELLLFLLFVVVGLSVVELDEDELDEEDEDDDEEDEDDVLDGRDELVSDGSVISLGETYVPGSTSSLPTIHQMPSTAAATHPRTSSADSTRATRESRRCRGGCCRVMAQPFSSCC